MESRDKIKQAERLKSRERRPKKSFVCTWNQNHDHQALVQTVLNLNDFVMDFINPCNFVQFDGRILSQFEGTWLKHNLCKHKASS